MRERSDLQPLELAEPAALVGLGQAVAEVDDDLVETMLPDRVGLQERAPQAGFSELRHGLRRRCDRQVPNTRDLD